MKKNEKTSRKWLYVTCDAQQGWTKIPWLTIVFLSLFEIQAWAQSAAMRQAEAEYAQAHNHYFMALLNGQASTAEEKEALREQTVGAAATKLNRVFNDQWHEAFSQVYTPDEVAERRLEPSLWANLSSIFSGNKKSASRTLAGIKQNNAPRSDDSAARAIKKDTALEGRGIPRLLEFKGTASPPNP